MICGAIVDLNVKLRSGHAGGSRRVRQAIAKQAPDSLLRHDPEHRVAIKWELGHAGHIQDRSDTEHASIEIGTTALIGDIEDEVNSGNHVRQYAGW